MCAICNHKNHKILIVYPAYDVNGTNASFQLNTPSECGDNENLTIKFCLFLFPPKMTQIDSLSCVERH